MSNGNGLYRNRPASVGKPSEPCDSLLIRITGGLAPCNVTVIQATTSAAANIRLLPNQNALNFVVTGSILGASQSRQISYTGLIVSLDSFRGRLLGIECPLSGGEFCRQFQRLCRSLNSSSTLQTLPALGSRTKSRDDDRKICESDC